MKIPKMNGYVRLNRDLNGQFSPNLAHDWELWCLYVFLLSRANWADTDVLRQGEVSISLLQISSFTNTPKRRVRWLFDKLKELDFIVESKGFCNKKSKVFLVKKSGTQDGTQDGTTQRKEQRRIQRRIQKKKNTSSSSIPPSDGDIDGDDLPYVKLAKEWNTKLPHHCQNQIALLKKNQKRKATLNDAIDTFGIDVLSGAIDTISMSDFLNGKNDRKWKPDLMWITKAENLQKISEGKYNTKSPQIKALQFESYIYKGT